MKVSQGTLKQRRTVIACYFNMIYQVVPSKAVKESIDWRNYEGKGEGGSCLFIFL